MYYQILFSPTGGTKRAADLLQGGLTAESTLIDLCSPGFHGAVLTAGDVAVIAVPSYGGRVPCTVTERMEKIQGNGARAILVCAYGNRAYDNTLAEMKHQAELAGFRPIAAVAALAEHSMARKVAAGRPDPEDAAALKEMAETIRAKLDSGNDTPVQVPGTVPEERIGNFGGKMAPRAVRGCCHCNICVEECPVLAIDADSMEADQSKCIGCMRCVAVCPREARKLNVIIESLGGVALSVLCSRRKENELFI